MINQYKIRALDIEEEYILISVTPALPNLTKYDLNLTYDDITISDYTLIDESGGKGSVYKIIPYIPFTPYDYVTFQIIKENYLSDKIKIYLSKCFYNGKSDIDFNLPLKSSGEYRIRLDTLNSKPFDVSSETVTVSYDIKIEDSSAALEGSGVYHVGEDVYVNTELYAIDNKHVPDGLYQIELLAEPI